jgi:hypothetical protein
MVYKSNSLVQGNKRGLFHKQPLCHLPHTLELLTNVSFRNETRRFKAIYNWTNDEHPGGRAQSLIVDALETSFIHQPSTLAITLSTSQYYTPVVYINTFFFICAYRGLQFFRRYSVE